MLTSTQRAVLATHESFGDLLKYLRRRARLTQRDLAIATGYSEAHICRLERNQRLPDPATLAAVFVPALALDDEPTLAMLLIQVAVGTRAHPRNDA